MISIIIPLYNKEKAISRTIYSVLGQTYQDFELIIINDGSTDNSLSIVSSFTDKRIRIINQENQGVSATRNNGVKLANGEWIIFLDADDIMLPYNLETLHNLVLKYKTNIGTANFYTMTKEGEKLRGIRTSFTGVVKYPFFSWFFSFYFIRTGNSIYKREVIKQYPFKTNLKRYEDYEMFLSLVREHKVAISKVPILLYTYEYKSLSADFSTLNKDFISCLDFKRSFWEKMILCQLYKEGLKMYPTERDALKLKYKLPFTLLCFYDIFYFILRAYMKVLKTIYLNEFRL